MGINTKIAYLSTCILLSVRAVVRSRRRGIWHRHHGGEGWSVEADNIYGSSKYMTKNQTH